MRLLFITHNTHRAGAPLVLVQFLTWLKQHESTIDTVVLDLQEGVLKDDFQAVCNDYINLTGLKPKTNSYISKGLQRLSTKPKKQTKMELVRQLNLKAFDVIYANTIKAIPYGVLLKAQHGHTKLIAHVHELPTVIQLLLPDFKAYVNDIDRFIAVSNLVQHSLHAHWQIPQKKISRVYPYSVIKQEPIQVNSTESFHIGASGLVDWRKGYDVFIQVARYVKKQNPKLPIQFTWVGGISDVNRIIIEADLLKLGLADVVSFVGELSHPFEHYNRFDVFLMCSREDPFPLVCIEVAMLKKPIICFEKATGTAEVIEQGGGEIVPYLDVEAMGDAVLDYAGHPEKRLADGARAQALFSEFTPHVICPQLFQVIQAVRHGQIDH
ncbi:glycosyltransferase family 4 protein [Bizionia hallyeonensis]|uniref:Glycosyltransferase family 4 protein n=1 Tax=Bizionia hallyeonensis TaxID=1123757 RepID=A0ABW0C5F1_9FLAO